MAEGYIKDYRKELDSDIWLMPPLYHRVWQWIKYKVNHAPHEIPMRDGSKLLIQPGQHLTSIRKIAEGVAWYERGIQKIPNPKTISAICDWLALSNMITLDKSNSNYTLITVANWELYQIDEYTKVTVNTRTKVTAGKHSMDINNNDKNDNNEFNNNIVGQPDTAPAKNIPDEDKPSEPEPVTYPYREIIDYFNQVCGTIYTAKAKKTQELIRARINEGFTLEDFKKVIDIKHAEWHNKPEMAEYIRPITLFGVKFESYLNQKAVAADVKPDNQVKKAYTMTNRERTQDAKAIEEAIFAKSRDELAMSQEEYDEWKRERAAKARND